VEVASHVAEDFGDGTWFVDLSPLRDPELVPSAIAATLNVREDRDRPLIETLKQHLASRRALVLLDNFEARSARGRTAGVVLASTWAYQRGPRAFGRAVAAG
jgi:hypothetical protein